MPLKDRRRYPRHRCAVHVRIKDRRNASELVSADVSRHGAFVVTDSPRPTRELVSLSFQLPEEGDVEVLGMVARRVKAEEASGEQPPGMGIDFFAMSQEAKEVWDRFVQRAMDSAAQAEGDGGAGRGAAAPAEGEGEGQGEGPTRRRHPRYLSCFLVQLRDRDRLREFFTRDISGGGMFLKTPAPDNVSDEVELIIVHPETKEEFHLQGRVVRRVADCPLAERGIGIRFMELTPAREAALVTFIESGVNFLEQASASNAERADQLERAVELVGDSVPALVVLGRALLEEIAPRRAAVAFKRALSRDAGYLGAHRGIYKAWTMLGELERAAQTLETIRRLERTR
jgi:c-di-GMP-binding flagellar brake protein YcgR